MAENWERYFTPTSAQRRLGMTCLGVGAQRGSAHCPPRVLDCYAAVFVVDGPGRLESGRLSTSFDLVPPVLFWLFPGMPHTYGPHRTWQEIWVLFDGSAAGAYEDLGYLSRTTPVTQFADPTAIRHTLDRLLDTCREHQPGVDVAAAHLVHELVLTAQRARHDPDGATDAAVLNTLRDAACSPMSVDEHAARLGLSLSALRRVVRRAAGCAPKEYLLRIRLNHAKALLAGSELTIAEVAREVGHHDPAYFSRIFTQRSGMSPREFRQQQRRR